MTKADNKIYAFYYKPGEVLTKDPIYYPIFAGKNNKHTNCQIPGDDTGIQISSKNKYYSELTGIFWVWKNTRSDIVGTCHYRRYFTTAKIPFLHRLKRLFYYPLGIARNRTGLIYTSDYKHWSSKIISANEIETLLKTCDVIMPTRRVLRQNIKLHYIKHHNPEDLILLEQILKEYYPDYLNSFTSLLSVKRLFANNMFIMRWEMFDELMTWLFDILEKFEERIDLDNYKGYQQRIFGFLSERLITLWILHNNINYRELPLIYFKQMKHG